MGMETQMIFRFGIAALLIAELNGNAVAAADPAHGMAVFKKCAVCHTIEPGAKKVGPSLFGVVGRPAGTLEGFAYSEAMKTSGLTWDEATLNTYLTNPKALVPKTKMIFPGLKVEQDRLDVIEYLKTLK